MFVQVQQLAPIPLVMYRHTGPYDQIAPLFDQLWRWAESHGVPGQRTLGIYWDNPDYTAASQLRSAACIEVPSNYVLGDTGGLRLELGSLAGGNYAITKFTGPYEQLAPVWTEFTNYIEQNLRKTISENPAFEVYVNDPANTPPNQLITELYMPVL